MTLELYKVWLQDSYSNVELTPKRSRSRNNPRRLRCKHTTHIYYIITFAFSSAQAAARRLDQYRESCCCTAVCKLYLNRGCICFNFPPRHRLIWPSTGITTVKLLTRVYENREVSTIALKNRWKKVINPKEADKQERDMCSFNGEIWRPTWRMSGLLLRSNNLFFVSVCLSVCLPLRGENCRLSGCV